MSPATIEDEVDQYLNNMAHRSVALCRRTDQPIELVRSHLHGAAMLIAQFMPVPTEDECEALEMTMRYLRWVSGNVIHGDIVGPPKRPRIRKAKPETPALKARHLASTKAKGAHK